MKFLGANFGSHMVSGGIGTDRQSGSSFRVQQTCTAQVSDAADLLKQVEELMAIAEKEKKTRKKLKISANCLRQDRQNFQHGCSSFSALVTAAYCGCLESLGQYYHCEDQT